MKKHKVIFTTDRGEWHQQMALKGAPEILNIKMLRNPDKADLKAALADAEFLISERFGMIDAEIIKSAKSLKLIQRLGSQVHDIDLETASRAGIKVCYQPIGGVIRVAEHLIMQMLAVGKKLREVEEVALAADSGWGESKRTDEDTFAYNWSGRMGINQLWERNVGVIGFGEIGVELSRRLSTWGCSILYHKRSRLPTSVEKDLGLTYLVPEEIFARANYLVNLLPFVQGTEMYFNKTVFQQMKTGAVLVSCGSGSTIDEMALADAVNSGKLGGVALDTFEYEPLKSDNPLIAAAKSGANILLTPHTAAGTLDGDGKVPDRGKDYQNIINLLNGNPLEYQVI